MRSLFGSPEMAAGYAKARPPLHGTIVDMALGRCNAPSRFRTVLDVGCGAGLSTRPLFKHADVCVGAEPVEAMLHWARSMVPGAHFITAKAESLPLGNASVDLITAAGSLNYADIGGFFEELPRVLRPGGVLVVYDFSQGKSFRGSSSLDQWHAEFLRRYPAPRDGSRTELDPEILAGYGAVQATDTFELALPMNAESYTAYAMTETNVAGAIGSGVPEEQVREWCRSSVAEVFGGGERAVLFRGYFVCLGPA